MSIKSALKQYLETPIKGGYKTSYGGKREDNVGEREKRLLNHIQSFLNATESLPSAGSPTDKREELLKQYVSLAQGQPHAGHPERKNQELLKAYADSSGHLPSASGPQDGVKDAVEKFAQVSQGLPSAGREKSGLDARVQQFVQSSQSMPSPMAQRVKSDDAGSSIPLVKEAVEKVKYDGGQHLHFIHNAFNGGEIDPFILARFDQPRYQTGSVLLENFIPMPQGGLQKRPGFEAVSLAGPSHNGEGKSRLFPFIFSAADSCVMEITSTGSNSTLNIYFSDSSSHSTGLNLPYTSNDLDDIQITQSADVVYIVHRNHKPAKIMRYGRTDWRYATLKFTPAISTPSINRLEIDGSSSDPETTYKYAITAIDSFTGQESKMSAVKEITAKRLSSTYKIKIYVNGMSNVSEFRIYKYRGGVYGYIGSINVSTSGSLVFEDNNIEPDTEDTPLEYKDPFTGAGDYPSVVFLHQQRLGFAATNNRPLTVWLSRTGEYESLAASTPPEDDDAIEVTLAANQANRIIWALSDRNVLAVGTEGGEWILSGTDGAALTPKDLSFQAQTYHGSEDNRQPFLRAGSSLLYLQRGGHVAREFGYNFASDKYESSDLSLLARHILRINRIISWAWQSEPYSIAWCVLEDGTLAGLTYMKEHEVIAWHRHISEDGLFKDCCAIPSIDGIYDVFFVCFRNGKNYIEKLMLYYDYGGSNLTFVDGVNKKEFTSKCIPCLPESNVQNGNSFMRVKKINAIKVKVINSMPFKARVGSGALLPVPIRDYKVGFVREDCWAVPMGAGWRDGDRVEIICQGPDPVTILGLITTLELSEWSGGNK